MVFKDDINPGFTTHCFQSQNEANEEIKSRVQALTVINLDLIQLQGF